MLSSSFDIAEFLEKVKGHSYHEIIWMTDQEATAAERQYYKKNCDTDCEQMMSYARSLKDFICFMRHGICTRRIQKIKKLECFAHFQ